MSVLLGWAVPSIALQKYSVLIAYGSSILGKHIQSWESLKYYLGQFSLKKNMYIYKRRKEDCDLIGSDLIISHSW